MRIGIDLGGTKIEVIALGDQGKELFRKRVDTPRNNYQKTLEAIVGLIIDAEKATGQQGTVGIGIPGAISPFTGKVKNANSVWMNGQILDKDIAALLGREVRIANDANCLAVSEATDGAGERMPMVFAVIIGTGCGSGIAFGGQVHAGGNGLAGEWGHNPLPWMDEEDQAYQNEVRCFCGKPGCTETFVSGTGFMTDYFRLSGVKKKGYEIIEALAQGDKFAELAISRYERRLARALAQVINLLDPDVIVLGGGMSNVDRIYQTLPDLVKEWVFGGECATPIRKAVHGDSSGVRGAAWLWPQQ
ncbi:fructokinase [Xenorhabdus japonica]|uniref:Fructokinase n=1 Tax=Xenorhabdus japonica TaxID=53341 RepID=A0A1I4YK10_9GAMM|nr:fructokinase [Xenorhabdus japonica]SFN37889.1 fructokinase [Xenorhabdus japonica]